MHYEIPGLNSGKSLCSTLTTWALKFHAQRKLASQLFRARSNPRRSRFYPVVPLSETVRPKHWREATITTSKRLVSKAFHLQTSLKVEAVWLLCQFLFRASYAFICLRTSPIHLTLRKTFIPRTPPSSSWPFFPSSRYMSSSITCCPSISHAIHV